MQLFALGLDRTEQVLPRFIEGLGALRFLRASRRNTELKFANAVNASSDLVDQAQIVYVRGPLALYPPLLLCDIA